MQKESTKTELRNSSYDQTKFKLKSGLFQIFKLFKNIFELDYWIDGIITKKWAFVSLDLDKRVKSSDRLKTRG
mgnify:CR=1 FL=1